MSAASGDFEGLLRRALAPVEPPADLVLQLETTLESLTELAAEELDGLELAAMRDPRNWVRPAAAIVIGTGAGTALVVLRARRRAQQRRRADHPVSTAAERALHDVVPEARRILR
jgi:hypothetical protein